MSRKCDISKKRKLRGNKVSHSKVRTNFFQLPNLQTKRFWHETDQKWVTLKVTTRMIRTILKLGLAKSLKKYKHLQDH